VVGARWTSGLLRHRRLGGRPTFNGGNPVSVRLAAQASRRTRRRADAASSRPSRANRPAVPRRCWNNSTRRLGPTPLRPSGTVTDAATGDEAFYGVFTGIRRDHRRRRRQHRICCWRLQHRRLGRHVLRASAGSSFPIGRCHRRHRSGITTDGGMAPLSWSALLRPIPRRSLHRAGARIPHSMAAARSVRLGLGLATSWQRAVESAANGSGIVAAGASAGSVVVVQLTPWRRTDSGFGTGGIVSVSALAAPDLNSNQPNQTEGIALDPAGSNCRGKHDVRRRLCHCPPHRSRGARHHLRERWHRDHQLRERHRRC